ncbi:MAG: formylglycine-generating enzyme family protein [Bacteroidia bacterium]
MTLLTNTYTIHQEKLVNGVSFNMVFVEGDKFIMGDDEGDYGSIWEPKPAHEVELGSFYIGQYPVTQVLWESVMGDNPSYFKGYDRPVERVHWYDSVEFCNRLSERCGLEPVYQIDKTVKDPNNQSSLGDLKWLVIRKTGANGYRLPTEAEWEYAARGCIYRSENEYAGSARLENVGWFRENSHGETQPVGLLTPNELGLYDMSGNVWEWCEDWFDENYYRECYQTAVVSNPKGPEKGRYRVLRGGSWDGGESVCRVAFRLNGLPDDRYSFFGFRLSRTGL